MLPSSMPASQSVLQFISNGVEVRGLCRPTKFFRTKLRKPFLLYGLGFVQGGALKHDVVSNVVSFNFKLRGRSMKNRPKGTPKCAANVKNTYRDT